MRASFAILAVTSLLALAITLILGYSIGPVPPRVEPDAPQSALAVRHTLAAIVSILFCCFVHVISFTYFIVCARMARDAVDSAGLAESRLAEVVAQRRRALRRLLVGVGAVMMVGVSGAVEAVSNPGSPQWHFWFAHAGLLANGWSFWSEFGLITTNVSLTERIYADLPAT